MVTYEDKETLFLIKVMDYAILEKTLKYIVEKKKMKN